MRVAHSFVSAIPDNPAHASAGKVVSSNWNADHVIEFAGSDVVTALGYTPVTDARTVSAGSGLSGGGDLSANRTISLNVGNANTWTAQQTFNSSAPVFGTMTAGSVLFAGTSGVLAQDNTAFNWDNSNKRLGLGGAVSASELLHLSSSANAQVAARIETTSSGTSARASLRLYTGSTTLAGVIYATSSGWTINSYTAALVISAPQAGGVVVAADHASGPITFISGASERGGIDASGNWVVGTAALATNATNGFLYIPTCAGAPSGTPTAKTGRCAMVYDSSNNALKIYNGAWKSVTLS